MKTAVRCIAYLFVVSCLAACGDSHGGPNGSDADGGTLTGARYGAACSEATPCREGLRCSASLCQPRGDVALGGRCTATIDCLVGNYCAPGGTCAPGGAVDIGGACTSTGDCMAGAVCDGGTCAAVRGTVFASRDGTVHYGEPGTLSDLGGTCERLVDCIAGATCTSNVCTAP